MPRPAKVTREEAVAALEVEMEHFRTSLLPKYSSTVWQNLSKALGGKWSAHDVYCSVSQDRRKILTLARKNQGIHLDNISQNPKDENLDSTLDDSLVNEDTDDPYEFEQKAQGLDTFYLEIFREEWDAMVGSPIHYGDGRVLSVLHREKWAGLLSIIIFLRTHLPCAYSFNNSKIYNSPDSFHYCRITGHCKSKRCGNQLFCYLDKPPPDDAEKFTMTMRTRDTFYDDHEVVKRDLRGYLRQQVGEKVYYIGAGNFQKEEALKDTKFGGRVGPNVPQMSVLRKTKNDFISRKWDLKPGDGKDVVTTIEVMRYTDPYNKFIHEVRRDKFYVSFSAFNQMIAYKQYCRLNKDDSIIGIDGSGSLIKKFRRLDGTKTGHIFLYSVTINQNGRTIAVHEALTESQETNILAWWLAHWLRMGAPIPGQISSDRSRALMNGISQAFNNMTVKVYVEVLFARALNGGNRSYYPPVYTYLRNDVAHLIIAVAKWNVFKKIPFSTVRQFYLYSLGLLIESQNLEQFREFFLLILTIGLHKSDDDIIRAIEGGTVADCRNKLEGYIASRNFPFKGQGIEECAAASEIKEEVEEPSLNQESPIKNWIDNLRIMAEHPREKCEIESGTLNVYYANDFMNRLVELVYEFPLWSAAVIPRKVNRSSTAFTEGFFNDLKRRVFKNQGAVTRADLFLKRMFTNNCGGAELFSTDMKSTRGKPINQPGAKHGDISASNSSRNRTTLPSRLSKNGFSDGDHSEEESSDKENVQPVQKPIKEKNLSDGNENNSSGLVPSHSSSLDSSDDGDSDSVPSKRTDRDFIFSEKEFVSQSSKEKMKRKYCEEQRKIPEHSRDKIKSPERAVKRARKIARVEETHETRGTVIHDERKKPLKKNGGKYFQARPDILHRNGLACNIHKSGLIINGNVKKGKVSISGKTYFSSNTCGFDSIVQIVGAAMMNNEGLKDYAIESTNKTLQFILEFLKNGSQAKIYVQRTKLLQLLFPERVKLHYPESNILASNEIDMFDHVVNIWQGCFGSEPALTCFHSCSQCGSHEIHKSTLTVDSDLVDNNPKNSYRNLQEALQFHFVSQLATCTRVNNRNKYCNGNVLVNPKALGNMIFIELDVPSTRDGSVLDCQLAVMPKCLELMDDKFQLAGIISSSPGHHTSYCWRPNDTWEFCDDRASGVASANQKTKVKASAVIYVKIFPRGVGDNSELNASATPPRTPIISPTPSPPSPKTILSPLNKINYSHTRLSPTTKNQNADDYRKKQRDSDTFSRDNWRNKGDPDIYWGNETNDESVHLKSFQEDTVNTVGSNDTFPSFINPILSAGEVMPDVQINGQCFHLINTTILDSIIHILLYTAIDDKNYLESIESSSEKLLSFIVSLKDREFNETMYADKAALLSDLFAMKTRREPDSNIIVLDLDDSVSNLWQLSLPNAPSLYKTFECQHCGPYAVPISTINIDSQLIYRQNFTVLQQALEFHPMLQKVPCVMEGCKRVCLINCHANFHVFINLEIKMRGRSQKTIHCKLSEIPTSLTLDMKYRLAGIIAYSQEGFVAYCYRLNDSTAWWELYSSHLGKIKSPDRCDIIEPHGAIYVVEKKSH